MRCPLALLHYPGKPRYWLCLRADRRWHSRLRPDVAAALNRRHRGTFGPARGTPGAWQAHDAAQLTGGEIRSLVRATAMSPDTVY